MNYRLIALDPGITTGYAIAIPNGPELLYLAYSEHQLEVEDLFDLLLAIDPTHIIYESFEYRRGQKDKLELFPVQLIGIIRYYRATRVHKPPQVDSQSASMGKGYFTDTILKDKKLYQKATPHGRDAARHLLHWLTFRSGYQLNVGQEIVLAPVRWLVESYLQRYEWKW